MQEIPREAPKHSKRKETEGQNALTKSTEKGENQKPIQMIYSMKNEPKEEEAVPKNATPKRSKTQEIARSLEKTQNNNSSERK